MTHIIKDIDMEEEFCKLACLVLSILLLQLGLNYEGWSGLALMTFLYFVINFIFHQFTIGITRGFLMVSYKESVSGKTNLMRAWTDILILTTALVLFFVVEFTYFKFTFNFEMSGSSFTFGGYSVGIQREGTLSWKLLQAFISHTMILSGLRGSYNLFRYMRYYHSGYLLRDN